MDKNAIDQYLQSLKAMGLSDDTIAMYKQQLEQSMQFSSQWAGQLNQFGQQMQQFNTLFNNDASDTDDDTPAILLNPDSQLSNQELWALACGADLALLNGQYLNDLTTGFSRQECRNMLSQWWDIDSKEEAQETIEWLFTEGHRIQFDIIWQAMNTVSIKESKAFLRDHVVKDEMEEETALQRLRNMRDALELFQERKLISKDTQPEMLIWDFARIINLSRGSFDAGYLTQGEAMGYILRCVGPIRSMYNSWKQLSVSYQFARCVWNGIDEEEFVDMMEGMNLLLTDANSPWVKMPWD
ncbi:DUF1266 domain-containing protein [Paraflavitalea sp. CAU 1676]|uniref:DUF1266 domain-containing protein n=1 Tax=Paraflavitalea sp. CAU 1676 TaxID=3032598 RepID=UPI0023DCC4B8|nr:DUF1266 domain-containing protein [Paraflavitalea sp. CAU 1676]MDF2186802.1 DUF1266 domain-containing protein [Paraflavitalea sp. CAU 1676]